METKSEIEIQGKRGNIQLLYVFSRKRERERERDGGEEWRGRRNGRKGW